MLWNLVQTNSNLIWLKQNLPELENFEIKYGFEGFDEGNKFPYRNFLIFEMDVELKIRELLVIEIHGNLREFALEPQDLMNNGQKASVCT
jgi:hypothetical protein